MKLLILTFIFLSIISCRKEEEIWDELTDGERTELQNRSNTKCLSQAEDDVLDLTSTSNTELLRLSRLDSWKLEYFKGTTPTDIIETSKIYVWKISGSTVYFLLKLTENGSPVNKFVKFTSTTNSEMFEDLRQRKCITQDITLSVSQTLLSAGVSEAAVTEDTDTYSKTVATHSYPDELPAFFGFFNKKRVKTLYNDETDAVKSSETSNWVITRIEDVSSLPTDFTNNTDYPNKTYCVVDYTAGTPNVYPIPNASGYGLECGTSATDGPDPDGDTVENFDPATELI